MCTKKPFRMMFLLLALVSLSASQALAHTCPVGAVSTGGTIIFSTFHEDGVTPIGAEPDHASACENIVLQVRLQYAAGTFFFEGGTITIRTATPSTLGFSADATPSGGVPLIGDPLAASPCTGATDFVDSTKVTYVVNPADIVGGNIFFQAEWTGTAHKGANDLQGAGLAQPQSVTVASPLSCTVTSPQPICAGASASLTANGTGGTQPY